MISETTRQKMRLSHLGKKLPREQVEKIRQANTGMKRTSEQIERIQAGRGKHNFTLESKAKTSQMLKKLWQNPEYREQMYQAHRGHKHSEEQKRKIGINTQQALLSPEINSKLRLALKHNWENPELRERHSQIFKGRIIHWADKLPHGEQHWSWNGGSSFGPYDPNFTRTFKKRILKRDSFTCQLCGIPENGHHHCIHHMDYNKQNTTETSCITLCLRCNIKVNTNREYWQVYFTNLLIARRIMSIDGFLLGCPIEERKKV